MKPHCSSFHAEHWGCKQSFATRLISIMIPLLAAVSTHLISIFNQYNNSITTICIAAGDAFAWYHWARWQSFSVVWWSNRLHQPSNVYCFVLPSCISYHPKQPARVIINSSSIIHRQYPSLFRFWCLSAVSSHLLPIILWRSNHHVDD